METAPYGTWRSPIDAEMVAAAGGGPSWVQRTGDATFWSESRPGEGGRATIMCARDGARPQEVLPAPWNARNRVHEYGGRPFTVLGDTLVFTSWDDQRVHLLDEGHPPVPISPPPARRHGRRYAVPTAAASPDEVWCVRETITGDRPTDVRRELVALALDGGGPHRVLAGGPLFYPPASPDFVAPDGERPPLLVHVHGGPTGRDPASLDLEVAFFTSRGFAVVAPDYGGSTGHGRVWRERLREQWGVVDVEDCAAVALALAAEGSADRHRLLVRGGSAGGWTTAASLAAVPPAGEAPVYRCGTSLYPILDLLGWASGETHDFESRYLDGLVGPLPAARERYLQRSPSCHPERLTGPILLLQGLDDQICPPVQADRFVAALAGSGIPHAYLTFEGEQHGFRRAETIAAAVAAELAFYAQVLGIEVPDVARLDVHGLDVHG